MKTISSESFTKIESLIPENHVNVHARVRQWLNEEESQLFAYPDFPTANSGQWCSNACADLKKYADATPVEKEEIAISLENSKATILPKLAKLTYASNLFKVPSEQQIFWYRGSDGQVRVVLAQWGFKLYNTPRNVDVIDVIINLPRVLTQTEVNVHITYSDDKPAANETFSRFMFNNQQDFTTDESGSHCFGQMYPNQRFSVSDKFGTTHEFVVEKDKCDYYARFDIHTSYQVQVVNQNDEVMAGCTIRIDDVPHTTDSNGHVLIDDVILTPTSLVMVSCDDGTPEAFELSRDAGQNKFIYKIKVIQHTAFSIKVVNQDGEPKPDYALIVNGSNCHTDGSGFLHVRDCVFDDGKKLHVIAENGSQAEFFLSLDPAKNNFVMEVKDDIFTSYILKVTNQHGEVKTDFPVSIDGIQHKTNQYGVVTINNVLWEEGKEFTVYADDVTEQKYVIQRDSASNIFIYVVEDKQVRIRVLDFDGTPLDNIMVYVDTKKGVTISCMSDADGYATFPANAFQNNKKAKVHFKVTKEYREKREQLKKAQNT